MTVEQILEQLTNLANMTAEELSAFMADIDAASDSIAGSTQAELDQLNQLAEAFDQAKARQDEMTTEAAALEEGVAAAKARIKAGQPAADPEDPDADGDAEPETPSAKAPPAAPAKTPLPAAAAVTPATTTLVTNVRIRKPETGKATPGVPAQKQRLSLVASAGIPGIQAGEKIEDVEKLAFAMNAQWRMSGGASYSGPRQNIPVASRRVDLAAMYGDERILGKDDAINARKIDAVTSYDSLVASGGICAPIPYEYDLPILRGSTDRPIRDQALARFGADRGGVSVLPPPTLTDVVGAVDTWTHTNDLNPGSDGNATKTCLTFTCPSPTSQQVDALTKCLKFGNFRAAFFPEQITAWTDLVDVWASRYAEVKWLTKIGAGSTQLTAGEPGETDFGTTRAVLALLDRVTASFRGRHRLPRTFPLRVILPTWLLDNMRTDLMREQPGATAERLAMADTAIMGFFSTRNINITWTLDGESGQIFGSNGLHTGAVDAWPTNVVIYVYPEGSWLFLDGGQLDFGLTRDSTLNSTNDVVVFSETFEQVLFHGVESQRITLDICPSGNTQAAQDINVCAIGS